MAQRTLSKPVTLRLTGEMATDLKHHLFPGDGDEHGAVVGASVVETATGYRLLGRCLFLAEDGIDYVPGERGYRMLTADFVRRCAIACADQGLGYLPVHNHFGSDSVAFSGPDMASHRRGYPAVLDILDGPPAGGLVFARGAAAGDIWLSADRQVDLECAVVVGRSQEFLYPSPRRPREADPQYDRQVRLFGDRGQEILADQKVAIVGAGGAGSIINEHLARLGIGHLVVVDYDRLDDTNSPRVVGSVPSDLNPWPLCRFLSRLLRRRPSYKVSIAERVARQANPGIRYEAIVGSVIDPEVAERLVDCDAIFLAADTMQARLVVNALCHQYLIPTWQVGAKVVNDQAGAVEDVFSAVRTLIPGQSCLWCNGLVNRTRLAEEAASPEQRAAQQYVDGVPAPSVVTLNAVASAHAVNQYLFSTLGIQELPSEVHWMKYREPEPYTTVELPRRNPDCSECQRRLGAGRLMPLPVRAS